MNPEIKSAIKKEAARHDADCWRMEQTIENAFKAGAEYGYKIGKLMGLIEHLKTFDDKVASTCVSRLQKELQELLEGKY